MAKYVSDWHAKHQDMNTNPILRTYKLFKKEFKCECYLNGVKNSTYCKALTQFRTSSHTLEIEGGQQSNPTTPLEQRQCRICHVLEDEIHCRMFTDVRHDILNKIQNKYPHFSRYSGLDKFIFISQHGDAQVATWTAKFIYHAVKKNNVIHPHFWYLHKTKTMRHAYILAEILSHIILPHVFICMLYLTMHDFIDTTGGMCVFVSVSFNLQICVPYHWRIYTSMFIVLCMLWWYLAHMTSQKWL